MANHENYAALKNRQQEEINSIPFGAAFSEEQFVAMMAKWGLQPNDTAKIVTFGGGVYLQKKDLPAFDEMSERHEREVKEYLATDEGFEEALVAEFHNHESQYSSDINDALHAAGLPDRDKLDEDTARRVNKAWKKFYRYCCDNDLF